MYMSTAVGDVDDDILFDILSVSQQNNARNDISGLLLFGSGCFLQVLEGPDDAVGELYDTILSDTRHKDLVLIEDISVEEQLFGAWSMAYLREESLPPRTRRGFIDLRRTVLEEAGMGKGDPGIIRLLTQSFLNAIAAMNTIEKQA